MGRRFERHLDLDLIALIDAGSKRPKRVGTRRRKPRAASTYRGARRNAAIHGPGGGVWKGIKSTDIYYRAPVRANRSRNWTPFKGRLYAAGAR